MNSNQESLNPNELLNQYLSNLKVLNNNLYNMHWNLIGTNFFTIHLKLNEYYEKAADMYDEVAERIKMIGGFPITSLIEYEQKSTIKSMRSQDYTEKQVMDVLENDFSFLINFGYDIIKYFNDINDYTTSGMLSNHMTFFEKQLWMVKASKK